MKRHTLGLTLLLLVLALCQLPKTAHAQDWICGNDMRFWWWYRLHPHNPDPWPWKVSAATVTLVGRDDKLGVSYYDVSFSVMNASSQVVKGTTAFALNSQTILTKKGQAGYYGPDQDFNPNNPINPYATVASQTVAKISVTDMKPGQVAVLKGRATVPNKSNANLFDILIGF